MSKKERWASRLGLVLAMAGNAVGLGNFLRFPAQAVKNGGGAFLIPYLVALVLLGLPLIWIEWTMGRFGGKHGHHSSPGVFDAMGKSPWWKFFGVFGLWVNLIIASYYLYIESWTMAYAGNSLLGGFAVPGSAGAFFTRLIGDQSSSVFSVSMFGLAIFFVCMAINVYILSRGLAKGIELVAKVGMPLLILFAAILAVRGLMLAPGGENNPVIASPWQGVNYLWTPKYERLTDASVWLAAAGQIFFTLSIGMGSIHCYASYVREQDDIVLTGASAAWTNEFCEVILGGMILVPIAVAYFGVQGMEETVRSNSGLALGFVVFPEMFRNWGALAPAAGFMWFGLLFFAAITSSLAMGQPIMSFLQTEFGFTREKSALAFGGMLLPLAIPVACFNLDTFFTEFDDWGGTYALVLFATLEAVLFAWVFGMDRGWKEMLLGAEMRVPAPFYYVMKYVTPVLLMVILAASLVEPAAGWNAYVQAAFSGKQAPAWEFSGGSIVGKLMFKDLALKEAQLRADLAALQASPAAASAESGEKIRKLENSLSLIGPTRTVQIADRLLMAGAFLFFAALVWIAWNKRAAQAEKRP